MRNILSIILLLILCSCNGKGSAKYTLVASAVPTESVGKVIAIIDGDTFDILVDGNRTVRVRMDAIDAPEKGMPFYKVAKKYLSELCFNKQVHLEYKGTDQHGRSIDRSFLDDGTDISKEMIRNGMAWHYKQYSSDELLAKLEVEARNNRLGLWTDRKPLEPWVCRKLRRAGNHVEFSGDSIIVQPTNHQ